MNGTVDLMPRIGLHVDVPERCYIEARLVRRPGPAPHDQSSRVGVVDIGGVGYGSVRITGSPVALRRLAAAMLEAASVAAGTV
jgi:hypothetical protein